MMFPWGRIIFAVGLVGAWFGNGTPSMLWAGSGDQLQMEGHDLQIFVDYR
jgi:hypothetical protein